MIISHIDNMIKGWFAGPFEPSLLKDVNFEVATKTYKKGDKDAAHYHKISTEITVICSGQVLINQTTYSTGDIIKILPGEISAFEALEDTITTVVKYPSAVDDKFIVESVK